MGGDDLGSDDDYLAALIGGDGYESSNDDDDDDKGSKNVKATTSGGDDDKSSKRESTDDNDAAPAPSKKKRKKGGGELRELGIDIRTASSETQSRLLSELAETTTKFRPHQLAVSTKASDASSIRERINGIVSRKKLKAWNQKESPMVLIVCLSARRAVQVLKELVPLRIRAAKLFAKHMTIEEQTKQMESGSFGFAVGTPHRIVTLAEKGILSLEKTQFVVLDTFLNTKNFSVYTLPDTVPPTQQLLKEHVYPECIKRKDLRVAFV
jgi:protein CMS1